MLYMIFICFLVLFFSRVGVDGQSTCFCIPCVACIYPNPLRTNISQIDVTVVPAFLTFLVAGRTEINVVPTIRRNYIIITRTTGIPVISALYLELSILVEFNGRQHVLICILWVDSKFVIIVFRPFGH